MAVKTILYPQDEADVLRMGGKAQALARARSHFLVPSWFVVTPSAFDGKALGEAAKTDIREAVKVLRGTLYAVRSSAIDEDGTDNSFAGQLQSFLNVPEEEIEAKIMSVHDSAFEDSVQAYRLERGMKAQGMCPAVIVQKMVKADSAGVAFTADPVSHDRNRIAIMAVQGLADKLVSGEVNGDTYTLSRNGEVLNKALTRQEDVLSDAQKSAVAALAIQAEQHFGVSQDIEWAFEGPDLYLLQARAITTLKESAPNIIWDNSNIVESYSGVTSPLTFSFARYVYAEVYKSFSRLMGVSRSQLEHKNHVFDNMLGYINGHVYYNLLNWYRALALLPGFTLNREFMEQMMGVSKALPKETLSVIVSRRDGIMQKSLAIGQMAVTLCLLLFNALILPWRVSGFYVRLDRVLAKPEPALAKRSLQDLAEYYHYLERELLARWQTPIINDFLCMVAFGASQKLMKTWCGSEGLTLHNDFMIGQGDIVSAEPAQRIRKMADLARGNEPLIALLTSGNVAALALDDALKMAFESYLEKFGDRCTQELKLESLTLHEDPASLLQAIGYTARKEYKVQEKETLNISHEVDRFFEGRPFKKAVAKGMLHWAKKRIRDRENLRFERTRVFGQVRRVFLEIGSRLCRKKLIAEPRDIFYLRVDEILGFIEGSTVSYNIEALVALRKNEAKKFRDITEMPNRFESHDAVVAYLGANRILSTRIAASGDQRQGLGCCSGIVRGAARVVRDPRKETIQSGEILVARHTDPGWIALFSNAAGIVVERGSLLSHSAIVAREMGIPAIVAIPDIMDWLKTGDIIEMNGATGEVVKITQ